MRLSQADRLRRHRVAFERALADNITIREAIKRIAQDRWAAVDRRLAERRQARLDRAAEVRPVELPLQWWQRD